LARVHPYLTKLRRLAASLPETAEVEAWGHPTFRAGKKIFATFGEHEGKSTIGLKQLIPDQSILIQDPRFFVPPYVGQHGWIGIWVDETEWPAVEELVLSSYRLVALKRMLRVLDEDEVED
jgi:predicted DNA-binding protein (MmcQ/YjbR family)